MQTRCLSCGELLAGVAQLCEACEARENAHVAIPQPAERPTPAPAESDTSELVINLAFVAIITSLVLGAAVWLIALGGASTLGLSGNGDGPEVVIATGTQTPVTSLVPLGYETGDCEFAAPDGVTVECGYLTVPQDRAQPDFGRVRLPVAVFKSQSAERKADPIVYLDGGPGGDTLEGIEFLYPALEPLAANRDLIVFDQRGAGGSVPSLACPEVTNINYDHILRQFSIDERVAQDEASARSCYNRLVESGIDPTLARSAESAADVNDLRQALGYEQWNLYGVSYGTKLALTVMRDFPEGVRSAVLDSVYPLQSDLYSEHQAGFDRALGVLFESCASAPSCSSPYPELEQAFYDTVDRLNEIPVQFSIGSITGRSRITATIDGVWFSAFVFSALYSEDLIALLPKMIFDTRDHNYQLLKIVADLHLQDIQSFSQGMYFSVQCAEEAPFTDREAVVAAAEAHPRLSEFSEYAARSIFASCDEWQAPPAPASENEPVNSPVPALVLAGQFDPITPPE
ncbi:MAG TPA: alpha/beta fold hydrolase [Dehalococcoidia bacterium]|nr:alpha/beta fold hydrolase [Dehalococcoidia bacterium]